MTYQFIDNDDDFLTAFESIKNSKYIGIDTESDSLFSYYEKFCLLQLSLEHKIYLVDTLYVDISPLKEIFENPQIRKIFHSADSDIPLIKTKTDCAFSDIFDVMLAAKYIGIEKCGLNNLIEKYFEVKLNKKYQKADWGARPLTKEMLDYAAMDVYYLKKLKDIFIPQLKKMNLLEELLSHCEQFSFLSKKEYNFDPERYINSQMYKRLGAQGVLVARELFLEREKNAAQKDIPPFKVISNDTILAMAENPQNALNHLTSFKGISPYVISRHGQWIKEAIERGLKAKPIKREKKERKNHRDMNDVKAIYESLRQWRTKKAVERKMFPELILTNEILWKLSYAEDLKVEKISQIISNDFKAKMYAEEIINIINHALKNRNEL